VDTEGTWPSVLPVDEVRSKRRALAEPHAMVGMEGLKAIRYRTERRQSEKVSVKRRKANRKGSTWGFAELQAKTVYKIRLPGGVCRIGWMRIPQARDGRFAGMLGGRIGPIRDCCLYAPIVGIRSMPI